MQPLRRAGAPGWHRRRTEGQTPRVLRSAPTSGASRQRLAHPAPLLEEAAPQLEALGRAGAAAGHDRLQLVPVGLRVLPDAVLPSLQLRVGHGEAELPDLRHVALEELLARLLVPLRL